MSLTFLAINKPQTIMATNNTPNTPVDLSNLQPINFAETKSYTRAPSNISQVLSTGRLGIGRQTGDTNITDLIRDKYAGQIRVDGKSFAVKIVDTAEESINELGIGRGLQFVTAREATYHGLPLHKAFFTAIGVENLDTTMTRFTTTVQESDEGTFLVFTYLDTVPRATRAAEVPNVKQGAPSNKNGKAPAQRAKQLAQAA